MQPLELIRRARQAGRGSLNEADGKTLLGAFGVRVPRFAVARGVEDVDRALDGLKSPYAIKVLSQDILHKSDAGAVILGAQDRDAVRAAVTTIAGRVRLRDARVDGYLIEEMTRPGRELVIGSFRDPQFGPMIMVGLGGIFVELMQDVSFRLCPVDRHDAESMLAQLKGAKILDGARGQKPVDRNALIELIVKIGGADGVLMTLDGEIAELDLNPVIVNDDGAVAVDARFVLADQASQVQVAALADRQPSAASVFAPLFAPATIAVVGASSSTATMANTFIRRLRDFGYAGRIYPIHPKADEIEGLKCYRSLATAPEPIDYAYVAIGARAIPQVLREANGRARFVQVISSGFGEVADGVELQAELVESARQGGCRLLGPNCLGIYSPRGGVTFPASAPRELGSVGVVTQSGGLGTDIIKRGQWRGLRFSGLVTIGNSADVGPTDLLEFYLADTQTRVIGFYLEDVKDGRRFFNRLRDAECMKPVVILRGGRSLQGRVAAASHTGALAGSDRPWQALAQQTGTVLVDTVDQFVNALLAFQFLVPRPQRPTQRVVLFGNGGGTSVLATDAFADHGLDVTPFDDATLAQLAALNLPNGTSIVNPIDAPVATLQGDEGRIADRIFDIIYRSGSPDAVVMHINLAAFVGRAGGDPIDNLIKAAVRVQSDYPGRAHFCIVLRVDGSPELDDRRRHYRE
ncbi:MAG: acetate--CoA ligase family protein, partial [Casimicrobiaceae bacterium]